jgi:hypothetical protein
MSCYMSHLSSMILHVKRKDSYLISSTSHGKSIIPPKYDFYHWTASLTRLQQMESAVSMHDGVLRVATRSVGEHSEHICGVGIEAGPKRSTVVMVRGASCGRTS